MITFPFKGVESRATKGDHGWVGPPDIDLSAYIDEATAAKRLGGTVVPVPAPAPLGPLAVAPVPVPPTRAPEGK